MNLQSLIHNKALDSRSIFCRIIKNIGVGRLIFRARILLFKIDALLGNFNQRFIEYPWILQKLVSGKGKLLLDVGCTGSLLDHELLARGYSVVGLDINDHTMRSNFETFIQTNILNTRLPSEKFDVIVCISVIEHIGLNVYSQNLLLNDGDLLAIKEIERLLKPGGVFVLTLPYEGGGPMKIFRSKNGIVERRYDYLRLAKLLENFTAVDSSFFLCQLKPKCHFVSITKSSLDKISNRVAEGSLGCLILQKR